MQLEWIYYPITQYTVTGVGLIGSLALWASAKAEIRRVRGTVQASVARLDSGVGALTDSIESVRRNQAEPATQTPMPVLQGLNLTKRTQILRMTRRGESVHSIAAALQLPVGEVTLILKMEKLQAPALEAQLERQLEALSERQVEPHPEPKPVPEKQPAPLNAKSAARGIL